MSKVRHFIKSYQYSILISSLFVFIFIFIAINLRDRTLIDDSFSLWIVNISTYGLIIMLGIVICMLVLSKMKPKDLENVNVLESLVWIIIPSIILARAWHVVSDFSLYQDNFSDVFRITSGGLSLWGALLGGLIGIYIFTTLYGFNFRLGLNTVAIILPLGQIIGRLGNFINQELFGPPTDLPWGMYVEYAKRPIEYRNYEFFHPAFLYEIIGNFILFIILIIVSNLLKKRKKEKLLSNSLILIALYSLGYGIVRFFVEFYRLEHNYFHSLSVNQICALIMIIFGIIYLVRFYKVYGNGNGKN